MDISAINRSNVNTYDMYGYTPIMRVAWKHNESDMEHLISLGADITLRAICPNFNQFTTVHMSRAGWSVADFAMKGRNMDAFKVLLKHGYDVNTIAKTAYLCDYEELMRYIMDTSTYRNMLNESNMDIYCSYYAQVFIKVAKNIVTDGDIHVVA